MTKRTNLSRFLSPLHLRCTEIQVLVLYRFDFEEGVKKFFFVKKAERFFFCFIGRNFANLDFA